ncbi:MAG TPA: MBL fold metallo-hydrolase [Chloroflexia bacterium]|nr:MBL fold metallo-hydrolase [Chloroflexia bacterium]
MAAKAVGKSSRKQQGPRGPGVPLLALAVPAFALVMLLVIVGQQPDGRLHLWVLDVGQGEAILLRTPQGRTAVVDGGPGATPLLNALGRRMPFWEHNIDLVVLTNPVQDRLMGLVDLLGRYEVGQVVQTEYTATGGVQAQWLRLLDTGGVPVHHVARGETLTFAGEPEVALEVLGPGAAGDGPMSLRLTYASHSILISGDARAEEEGEMVSYKGDELRSQVLVVGHFGSKGVASPSFLATVRPTVAIVSAGMSNRFGYPSPETLGALSAAGALVYRTDLNGTVEIIADAERVWVRAER